MRPDGPRPLVTGPDTGPEPPFPLRLNGKVVKGFGRGSSELGIPTANIPIAGLSVGGHEDVESGVYYGFAGLDLDENGNRLSPAPSTHSQGRSTDAQTPGPDAKADEGRRSMGTVYPMVMSIGWNPFYKNTVRSVEVHILHTFPRPFYGAHMNLVILGFIRPEYDYVDRESLIEDIRTDIEVARRSVEREAYRGFEADGYLRGFEGVEDVGS